MIGCKTHSFPLDESVTSVPDNGMTTHASKSCSKLYPYWAWSPPSKWMIMDGGFSMPFVKGLLEVFDPAVNYSSRNKTTSRQGGVSPKTTGQGHQFFLLMESWMLMDFRSSTWMEMDSLKIWGPIRSLVFFPSWEMWLQGLKWRYASFEFLKTFEFKRSILVLQTLELLKLHSLWRSFCCRITAGIFRKQNKKRRTCSFSYSTSYSNSPSWFNSSFNNFNFNIKRHYIY